MKITLFTSDKNRHKYFVNLLSSISEKLFVIQESDHNSKEFIPIDTKVSPIILKYFEHVNNAQYKLFDNNNIDNLNKDTKIFPIPFGSINEYLINLPLEFLKSDIYLVFGSSYIKGDFFNFLLKKKTININAGISPYYRGCDCNFWALYDDNPHLVGATIHYLSKGLDNGPILYHAVSNLKTNPFEYTMSTIKSAFHSIVDRIKDNSIFKIKPLIQEKSKEIRFSKKHDFDEKTVKKYFEKKIDLNKKEFNNSLLKEPYFFDN